MLENSHSCLGALTKYLYKAIDEKDQVIANLREELERKNHTITAFLQRQTALEQRLMRIQEVLNFEDADEESLERERQRNEEYQNDHEEAVSTINTKKESTTDIITEEESKGKDELPNFRTLYFPNGEEPS